MLAYADPKKPISLHDVMEMENEDKLIEISEGEWETQTMASPEQGEICGEILGEMRNFLKINNFGRVYGPDTSFILEGTIDDIRTMRLPDVAFVANEKLQETQEGYFFTAPTLAVEIISPSENYDKASKKILDYLRSGVMQVWMVFPVAQQIVVYSGETVILYSVEDTIPGGEILPEFSLPVRTIFS